jgi:exonuclease SbcC
MRPLKLTMKAFGPYPNKEIIDFTELNDKNIFLITGPTGAGKTTIFDGISVAMYGESSGNERSAESLRSQFADEDILTEVELEFMLKGKKYCIHRIPKQIKKKTRGEGFTEQKSDAWLKIYNDSEDEVISGVNNVNKKIEEFMGINAQQFRQIMMIPQGEFRKLLTAESIEREKVLKKIFNTKVYEMLQKRLDDESRILRNEIKSKINIRDNVIEKIDGDENEELHILITAENKNTVKIIEKTKIYIEKDMEKTSEVKNEIEIKNKEKEKHQNKIFKSNENNKKLDKREEIKKEKEVLEAKKEEIENKCRILENGKKALIIETIEENYDVRNEELKKKDRELINLKQNLNDAEIILKKNESVLNTQQSIESEQKRQKLHDRITLLESYEDKVENYESIRKKVFDLDEKYKSSVKDRDILQNKIEQINKEADMLIEQKDKSQKAAANYEREKANLENVIELMRKLQELHSHCVNMDKFVKVYRDCEAKLKRKKGDLTKQKEKFDIMQEQWFKGQAALLAKELKEGEACPVCGCIHHVKLAQFDEYIPTKEELNREKLKLEKIQSEAQILENKFAEVNVEAKNAKENYIKCIDDISNKIEQNVDSLKLSEVKLFTDSHINRLTQNKIELEKLIKELEKEKKLYETYDKKLNKKKEEKANNENALKLLAKECEEIYKKYTENKSNLDVIIKEIPENIRDYKALKDAIKNSENKLKVLINTLEKAKKDYDESNSRFISLKSKKEQIEKDKVDFEKALENVKSQLKQKIKEAGFNSFEEYISSKLSKEELNDLENTIKEYDDKIKAVRNKYKDILEETRGLSYSDLEELNQKLKVIQYEINKLLDYKSNIENRVNNNRKLLNEIQDINEEMKEKEERYSIISDLALMAKGQNKDKITFERYVLAAFLEDILAAANLRLFKMTHNRYELRRTDEREIKSKQGGLELEVFDNYTGKARHVKTLSGGEGFKASLSMALGLSDVVQSYAGGISLDTMFIDEGFGTLDPESMDSAIQCLIDLQKYGRLVGIISHVPELKERINARLEVETSTVGSKTKFCVL